MERGELMTVRDLIIELVDMHNDLNVDVICVEKNGTKHEIDVVDINRVNSEILLIVEDGY